MSNMALATKSALRKLANKVCRHEVFPPISLADGLKAIKKRFGAVGKPNGIPGFRWYSCKDGTTLKIELTHPDRLSSRVGCDAFFSKLPNSTLQNLTELSITQQKPGQSGILSSISKRMLANMTPTQQVEGVRTVVIKPQGEFTHPVAFTTMTKRFSHNPYGSTFS